MKKRILIFGLTSNYGGMEKLTYAILSHLDHSKYSLVFVNNSSKNFVIDERIEKFEHRTICFNSKRRGRYKIFKNDLKKMFEDLKPDIVLEIFGDSTYVEPLVFAKKFKVKKRIALATMGSDVSDLGLTYKIVRFLARLRLNKSTTHFLSVSSKSSKYTFRKTKNVHIVSGINSEQFKFDEKERALLRKEFSIADNATIFSVIGRICSDKNQLFAIDYFNSYHSHNKNSYLFLIGNYENEYYDLLKNHIHSLGLENNVKFVESQPNVKAFYSFSDIILFPSLREGFGLIAVESQANGVPCLVFKETIDDSLKVTNNLIFISKKIEKSDVTKLINHLLSKSYNRENEYLKVRDSYLDLSSLKEDIRKVFE